MNILIARSCRPSGSWIQLVSLGCLLALTPSALWSQTVLSVAGGGTGAAAFTGNAILTGNGTAPLNATSWFIGGDSHLVSPNGAALIDNSGSLALYGANGGANINFGQGSNGGVDVYSQGTGFMNIHAAGMINLAVGGTVTPSGGNAYGILLSPTFGAGANYVDVMADWPTIVPSQSLTSIVDMHLGNAALGSGSTLGTMTAIYVDPLTSGTNNYAFRTGHKNMTRDCSDRSASIPIVVISSKTGNLPPNRLPLEPTELVNVNS